MPFKCCRYFTASGDNGFRSTSLSQTYSSHRDQKDNKSIDGQCVLARNNSKQLCNLNDSNNMWKESRNYCVYKIYRKSRSCGVREQPCSCTPWWGKWGGREGRTPGPYLYKTLSFQGALTIPIFTYCVLLFSLTLKLWWGFVGATFAGTPILQGPSTSEAFWLESMDLQDFYGISDSPEHGHKFYCKQML